MCGTVRHGIVCKDGKTRRGLLLGRPRFGNDVKYMLIGLAECGSCGGGLQIRKRFEGGKPILYYECTTRRQRGAAVCDNRLQVKMDLADRAVLSLVESQVFGADVIYAVIQQVAKHLAATGTKASAERAALDAAATKLERQQQNLTEAIADGAGSGRRSLQAKLAEVEAQQAEVADRLKRLTALVQLQGQDLAALEQAVQMKVTRDWAGLLARHPLQARAIVRKFIQGRFVFRPITSGKRPRYEVTATASTSLIVGSVIPALLPPKALPRTAAGPDSSEDLTKPDRWWPQRDTTEGGTLAPL